MADFTVVFEDWSGGWAGDVDRGKARKAQYFGQDVMVYTDGLLGPRHPLRKVTLTGPPAVSLGIVDEAIIYENLSGTRPASAVIFANADFWYVANYDRFDVAALVDETRVGATIAGVAIDSGNGRVYFTAKSGATRMRYHAPGAGVTNVILNGTPPDGEAFVRWQERMLYAARDVLWYSEAADFTNWPAANSAPIGDGAPITAFVPSALALYVAKTSGWWVVTGVLGSTASSRQVQERQGVEPAQVGGGTSTTTKIGARTVAAWARGMLWLRRRANDYRTDLTTGALVPASAVENCELMSFTGAQMEQIATVRSSRQARLVGMSSAAALVDCQNVPESPGGVQHVVYVVGGDKTLSKHVFSSAVLTTADQVVCPLTPMEGANGPVAGYDPDHLWMAFSDPLVAGGLGLRAFRYRASRPGYGSDDPATQTDDPAGGHANVVGIVEFPDYWHPEGRRVRVSAVYIAARVYDNGYTSHYSSTARVRGTVTALGRTEQSGTGANFDSVEREWTEVVGGGTGDRDQMIRLDLNDAGEGLGFRLRLELEMVAIRRVWVAVNASELVT